MKVLVTGAGGQLGVDLIAALRASRADHEVIATDRASLDVSDRDAALSAVTGLAPDVIVHAGAWTAVDACESDPDRAYRINALGTRHMAEGARLVGGYILYVSTDYIFDGTAAQPYREWDRPNPLSVYGRSKLAGEHEVLGQNPGAAVVRTSWVCGTNGANMVKTIMSLASSRPELAFVDDQRGCPTFTEDLAAAIVDLVVARRPGIFHVTNQGETTWYRFACDIVALCGRDPAMVRPISTAELDPPRPAPRPANSVLDNAAMRLAGMRMLADHHEPLERAIRVLMSRSSA